jgi:hypothetical protein
MIESTQYASDGTEYCSNISSEVTALDGKYANIGTGLDNARILECNGEHNLSVMSTG